MNNLHSNSLDTTSATVSSLSETILEAVDAIIGGLMLDKSAITWMYNVLDLQYFLHKVIKDLQTSKILTVTV